MTDWARQTADRNYGIGRKTDRHCVSELLKIILSLVAVSVALLFCSWVRSQIISVGYESQKLLAVEESLLRNQKSLILEEETLKNPERIDSIARNQLGLTPLHPNQLIPAEFRDLSLEGAGILAMATPSGASDISSGEPGKSAASN
jgi:cell division protein FtsL